MLKISIFSAQLLHRPRIIVTKITRLTLNNLQIKPNGRSFYAPLIPIMNFIGAKLLSKKFRPFCLAGLSNRGHPTSTPHCERGVMGVRPHLTAFFLPEF